MPSALIILYWQYDDDNFRAKAAVEYTSWLAASNPCQLLEASTSCGWPGAGDEGRASGGGHPRCVRWLRSTLRRLFSSFSCMETANVESQFVLCPTA